MPETPGDEVLTVDEVAALLKIEPNTVRALCRRGELPGVKLGKHWRFLRSEILAAIRPAAPAPPASPLVAEPGLTMTQAEAAAALGVTTRTIRRMIQDGRIERVPSPTGVERVSRASVLGVHRSEQAPDGAA